MLYIYILKIIDQSDFDRVLHESAHVDLDDAYAYADHVALPAVKAKIAAEWHYAIETDISPIEFHPANGEPQSIANLF